MAKDLAAIRFDVALIGLGVAGANADLSGAPKPTAEVPVHVALTATDFVMCAAIYTHISSPTYS